MGGGGDRRERQEIRPNFGIWQCAKSIDPLDYWAYIVLGATPKIGKLVQNHDVKMLNGASKLSLCTLRSFSLIEESFVGFRHLQFLLHLLIESGSKSSLYSSSRITKNGQMAPVYRYLNHCTCQSPMLWKRTESWGRGVGGSGPFHTSRCHCVTDIICQWWK